jgi:hypothetical protein
MTTVRLPRPLTRAAIKQQSTWADKYLFWLSLILLGYAVDGRGFAYLFMGELALLAGLALVPNLPGWTTVFQSPQIILLIPFWLWGAARSLPYWSDYHFDVIRDAMLWGYSAFAFIIAALLISDPSRLFRVLWYYQKFTRYFLAAIPVITVVYRGLWSVIPRWPWGGVPIIEEKEGDVCVHLATILSFWIAGLDDIVKPMWIALLALNIAVMGVIDRAGLLAFLASTAIVAVCRPLHPIIWRLAAMAFGVVFALWITGVHIAVPGGKGRDISFDQIATNVGSLLGSDTGSDGLDSTKEWRIAWWKEIRQYTFHGPFFWTGKGFGVNLADDDGGLGRNSFQVLNDHSLRAPHSAHMDFLAREGVPGLALWIGMQLFWGGSILNGYITARVRKDIRWRAVFLFLLASWVAFMVNMSFDVFLEGPMGGVWFWSIYGTGAAALWIYKNKPEALYAQ